MSKPRARGKIPAEYRLTPLEQKLTAALQELFREFDGAIRPLQYRPLRRNRRGRWLRE